MQRQHAADPPLPVTVLGHHDPDDGTARPAADRRPAEPGLDLVAAAAVHDQLMPAEVRSHRPLHRADGQHRHRPATGKPVTAEVLSVLDPGPQHRGVPRRQHGGVQAQHRDVLGPRVVRRQPCPRHQTRPQHPQVRQCRQVAHHLRVRLRRGELRPAERGVDHVGRGQHIPPASSTPAPTGRWWPPGERNRTRCRVCPAAHSATSAVLRRRPEPRPPSRRAAPPLRSGPLTPAVRPRSRSPSR